MTAIVNGEVYSNLTPDQAKKLQSIEGNGYGTGVLVALMNQALNVQTGPSVPAIADPVTATAEDVANAYNALLESLIQANVIAGS